MAHVLKNYFSMFKLKGTDSIEFTFYGSVLK